ncbi:nicotinamide N-methyltransferase-like [Ixodes scapularis]|uniref:nicotinamide N-methyltransferase-like n=1 Tax=Ixodes scapularis TaxID=6945 RepID=UPI001A9E6322|nr:nicotinamide N-methyltransferase-like [Ixodes scapularis]
MSSEKMRKQYLRDFEPREYPVAMKALTGVHSFYQRELHSIFNSPVSDSWRTLLDIGCGPTVANVFPATRKIQSIVLSDLLPRSRQEVEKWIQKAHDAINWSFMSEPLAILEGYKDAKCGAKDIEERTRAAIKKVIPCNVLDTNVLPEEHDELFDVVFSSLCLAAASRDEEAFRRVTRNVSGLIRDGGHLIFCGVVGSREYTVAGIKFPKVSLTKAMVEDALGGAGLQLKRWSSLDKPVASDTPLHWDFAFVVLAEKLYTADREGHASGGQPNDHVLPTCGHPL